MKPRVRIATARTPDGSEMVLYQHGRDFSIMINGQDLMNSRQHESELELARLGCAHLAGCKAPSILVGGLGMGYTLRQALDMLSPHAQVVVGELLGAVVEWNREFFGELNGQPLGDERVDVKTGDIVELISRSKGRFDAILLDIDNGPSAMTDSGNRRLYGREGIRACRRALRKQGCPMCAVSGFPLTRGVNHSHVLYGSLRRTRLSCPPVAVSRVCRSRTSRREVTDGLERDDRRCVRCQPRV